MKRKAISRRVDGKFFWFIRLEISGRLEEMFSSRFVRYIVG